MNVRGGLFMTAAGTARAVRGPALLAAAACLFSGCAPFRVPPGQKSGPRDTQVRLSVPFFPDDTDQCGPSALASVLGYWEKPEAPDSLRREIYRSNLKGSLTVDLLLAAESRGLAAELLNGSLDRVRAELAAGHPLIAFVDAGYSFYPSGHYLVLTGYDDRRQRVFAHSGLKRDQEMSYRRFIKQWKKTGQWTLLISPPQRL